MSQQKDEMAGLVFVVAAIGAAIYFVFIAMAVMMALFAIVFTILCLFAWNDTLYLGSETLEPEEARAFIYRGLFGAAAAPILTFLVWLFLDRHAFGWEVYALSAAIGYVFGSVGIEIFAAMDEMETISAGPDTKAETVSISPGPAASPSQQPALPPAQIKTLPAPPAKPFRYASWDDEEEKK